VSRFKASALGARVFASSARRLTEKEIVFDAPPIRFKGRPDLVAIDARGYVVVDYKTGGVSGPSGGEGLDPAYVAQAEVYAAAVFAATGAPTESSLFFVDDGRCATVVAASGGAAATVDRLREIARRAARAGAFFQKTSDAARCASCPHLVSGACDGAEGAAG
jgi:RecB family exonuclease